MSFHLLAKLTEAGRSDDQILLDPTIKVTNVKTQKVQTFKGTSIDLESGTYEYIITILGYEDKSGIFTLAKEDLEIEEEYIPTITVTYKKREDGYYDWKVFNPVNLGIKDQKEQYLGYRLQFVDTSVGAYMPTPIFTAFENIVKADENQILFENFERGTK